MEKIFKKLTGVLPIEIAEVGDYVQFGALAWKVIAVEDGKKLLLSKEWMMIDSDVEIADDSFDEIFSEKQVEQGAEDCADEDFSEDFEEDFLDSTYACLFSEDAFNKKYRACKSEYESIQNYLRKCFCEYYFSPNDVKRIVPHSIASNDKSNSEYVFLLSREEVEKYIPEKEDRIATKMIDFDILVYDVKKPWLLRFNESERYYFVVDTEGDIIVVDGHYDRFRPAVWVK